MPGGRPSSFKPEMLDIAEKMYSEGATDVEVAKACGVTSTTLDNWKKSKPEFLAALKRGKNLADDLVEKSLYQNALEGNTTAQIFWLKNRRPKDWRDKRELAVTEVPSPFEKFCMNEKDDADGQEGVNGKDDE